MDPTLPINTTLNDVMLMLLLIFGAAFIFMVYQAFRNFGTSQKTIYINTINDDQYIKAYMLNGAIYTRRYFFKLDDSSRLPFRYDDFPMKTEKIVSNGFLRTKVPVLKAVRTPAGFIEPVYLDIKDGKYVLRSYAAESYKRIVQSELDWIARLAAGFVNAPNSIMEAIVMGIKEHWIIVMAMMLGFGFLTIIGVGLQYKDSLLAVSENMKEVAEILREVSKDRLNVTNSTNSNVIVEIGNK